MRRATTGRRTSAGARSLPPTKRWSGTRRSRHDASWCNWPSASSSCCRCHPRRHPRCPAAGRARGGQRRGQHRRRARRDRRATRADRRLAAGEPQRSRPSTRWSGPGPRSARGPGEALDSRGTVLYADEPALIGQTFELDEDQLEALDNPRTVPRSPTWTARERARPRRTTSWSRSTDRCGPPTASRCCSRCTRRTTRSGNARRSSGVDSPV